MAAAKYEHRVVIGKKTVWSESFKDASSKNFPEEYRGRPANGTPAVSLFIDDELIGTQVSLDQEV